MVSSATALPGPPQSPTEFVTGQRTGSTGAGATLEADPAVPLSAMLGARKPLANVPRSASWGMGVHLSPSFGVKAVPADVS